MASCRYHLLQPAVASCPQCHLHVCAECAPALQAGETPHQCPLCGATTQVHMASAEGPWQWQGASLLWPAWGSWGVFVLVMVPVLTLALGRYLPVADLPMTALLGLVAEARVLACVRAREGSRWLSGSMFLHLFLSRVALLAPFVLLLTLAPSWCWVWAIVALCALPLTQLIVLREGGGRQLLQPWRYIVGLGAARASVVLQLLIVVLLAALLCAVCWLCADILPAPAVAALAATALVYLAGISASLWQQLAAHDPALQLQPRARLRRAALDPQVVRLRLWLYEGCYDKARRAMQLTAEALTATPAQQQAYVDLLLQLRDEAALCAFIPRVFMRLLQQEETAALHELLRQILQVWPDYHPEGGHLRLALAQVLRQHGQLRLALRFIHGWHQQAPQDPCIPEAYLMAAEMLTELAMYAKARAMLQFLAQRYRQHPLAATVRERWQALPQPPQGD